MMIDERFVRKPGQEEGVDLRERTPQQLSPEEANYIKYNPYVQQNETNMQPLYSPAREDFEKQLRQDISKTQEGLGTTAKRLGVDAEPTKQRFAEKGVRVGERLVAQKELEQAQQAQKLAVDRYITASGFTDNTSKAIATQTLNDKFNKIRQDLVKRGLDYQKKLEQYGVSQAEQRQAAKNWGMAAGAITGAYFGGPAGAGVGANVGGGIGQSMA